MFDTAKRGSAEMRYLLGDLSEDEKARMEEAFFADDTKFEELELAEEELIDAYVRDYLSPKERRQFQAKLLRSPRLVERVNFARVLTQKADALISPGAEESANPTAVALSPEPKPRRWWAGLFQQQPAFGAAFAASSILLLIGGGIFYGWLRLRSESERLASERAAIQRQKDEHDKITIKQQTQIEQLQAELKRAQDQKAEDQRRIKEQEIETPEESLKPILGAVLPITLATGSVRSGGPGNKVIIGRNHSSVRFSLPLDTNNYGSYNLVIENIDKGVPIPRPRVKPSRTKSGHQLIFQIPARNLPAGTYIVKVTGRSPSGTLEPVTDSQFTVSRQ